MKNVKNVKVNQMDNGFWLVPSFLKIFSPKSRNVALKHSFTLVDLIEKNDLQDLNIIFSFNGDTKFQHFNNLLKYRNYDFQLQLNQLSKLGEHDFFDWEVVENLIIRFNFKTIKTLYSGYTFFFTPKYFEYYYQKNKRNEEKLIVQWTKFGLEIISK
ncbi:hypothetical protein BCF59_0144 [Mycoplasmopsis mustelae]|uniref:Uncharacterized protein n=1 Tax=Mycoplasmopsis mustelae TaxID=171289 RepID=A0A4R7UEX2_9BACT|nr:hypothetical protein [Mycoplasmopsis mustelae]TDV24194.1 hypothetical protein BCF59_0144 [Mycoplasmopsis mustelae]